MAVPAYYDPHYGCEMEALRFDSDLPNPKYRKWIDELREYLELAPVVCKPGRAAEWAHDEAGPGGATSPSPVRKPSRQL